MINKIDNKLIEEVLGLKPQENIECDNLALSYQDIPNMLSFMDSEKFVQQMLDNKNVIAIFVTENLSHYFDKTNIIKIICDDPRYYFYTLKNYIGKANYKKTPSQIDLSSIIHDKAYVSEYNVQIGKNVIIEPNVTILPDVVIGDNCIIRANTVIGAEGFEHKRTSKGILSVFHTGKVIIGNNVEIGASNAISKGFIFSDTIIGDETRTDNLVHIAHSAQIGKRCFLPACAMVAGDTRIGDDCWIGPNASISSQVKLGNKSFITIGAVVTKDVQENQTVSGNFAVEHSKFINFIKTIR